MADTTPDVVDVLTEQHRRISDLLEQVRAGQPGKEQRFNELVSLLSAHEAAEEQVVHPIARRAVFGADDVVKPCLDEENHAKRVLATLSDLGVDHPEFDTRFAEFAEAVAEHASHEEAVEFALLRKQFAPHHLQHMARQVQVAESVAPTRPHPHAGESVAATMAAGPPLALFDRIRDALRGQRGEGYRWPVKIGRSGPADGARQRRRRYLRRSHSGEGIENGSSMPGIILCMLGVVGLSLALTAAGYGFAGWTAIAAVAGVVCLATGVGWVLTAQRRLRRIYRLPPEQRQGH
ncbi:hemerythrin domain-containing protein [Nocardia terpenica]|uniref:hemerythrin domain-containing protein n=1 Tax=Nocardia terpenica TaxID=455432 RepID=UPI001EEADF9D|nr:hemerythrin domain-containing protein [Nocardia terpenica]